MADPTQRRDYQPPQQQLQQKGQEAVDSFKSFLHEKAPSTSQVIALVTLFPVGAFLLFLAGLALTGSVLGLAVTAPLFVIFSPVIVPAALTIGLAVTGFLASGAFGITGLSAFSWIVTRRAREMARDVGQKTKEAGQEVSGKAREATRATTT
ncbi:hypothetical protein Cgig2_004127 [Carnegiea gigantea]|uniref:Oleosin n=1 Tax=Carnegiea gigantea TaxID=171969 RepID=A0A9Q1KUW8_9CARY|nr:hypothetical protein Cgig2_004127 [Carnegiea gigantea]